MAGCPKEVMLLARKVVRVYLPPSQKRVLDRMCVSLGMAESEALRTAFLEYAKSLGLVNEQVRGDRLS